MFFARYAAWIPLFVLLLAGAASAQVVAEVDPGPAQSLAKSPGQPHGQSRVAFVLGNGDYQHTTALTNPRNDAWAVTEALQRMNFDVLLEFDLDKPGTEQALKHFAQKLKHAEVALFYYAGHGLQVDGVNYLVPVDADLEDESDLLLEVIEMDTVLRIMESQQRVNLIFLDACRNNPLAFNLARSMGATRSAGIQQGLASMDAATGTLISFATKDNFVAMDGEGEHSPYARALLKHIAAPGVDVALMLRRVREDVMKSTENKQVPWEYGSLLGEFCFVEGLGDNPLFEIEFWRSAKEEDNLEAYQAYLQKYPDGEFTLLAYERIAALGGGDLLAATETNPELFRLINVVPKTQKPVQAAVAAVAAAPWPTAADVPAVAPRYDHQAAAPQPVVQPAPEPETMVAEARQEGASITLAANISGASVYLKQRGFLGFDVWSYQGRTPYVLEGVEPGKYEFRISKGGYDDALQTVVVEQGQERLVELALGASRFIRGGGDSLGGRGLDSGTDNGSSDSGSDGSGGSGGDSGGSGMAR